MPEISTVQPTQPVPLAEWEEHLTPDAKLMAGCYHAKDPADLINFLLKGRHDLSQAMTLLHMCEFLTFLKDHRPQLMRVYGDVVLYPRLPYRGRTFVLVEDSLEYALLPESNPSTQDITPKPFFSFSELFARLKEDIRDNSRIVPEAAGKKSRLADFVLDLSGTSSKMPYIDLIKPNGKESWFALDVVVGDIH